MAFDSSYCDTDESSRLCDDTDEYSSRCCDDVDEYSSSCCDVDECSSRCCRSPTVRWLQRLRRSHLGRTQGEPSRDAL